MKSSEDFLWVVLHGHIVAAAETIHATFDSSNLNLTEFSEAVIKKFVQITVPSPSTTQRAKVNNRIFLYATDVLTLGLIRANFYDTIRKGDADRLMLIWKF